MPVGERVSFLASPFLVMVHSQVMALLRKPRVPKQNGK